MRLSSPEAATDLKLSQAPVVGSAPRHSHRCRAWHHPPEERRRSEIRL